MSNCSRRVKGDKREEDQYPTTTYPYNNCFLLCHHLPNQYNTHTLLHPPSSVTYALQLFSPTAMPPFPPHPLCKIHPTTSCRSLSSSPQPTRKWATSSPTLLSHITHLSSLTILHLFLSSNNPAESVRSLNSNFTLSWPCTDLTYLSTPASSFANLYHFNVFFVYTSSQSFPFLAKGGLHLKPPKSEHIFVAVITFPPFFCADTFDTFDTREEVGSQKLRGRPRNFCDPTSSQHHNWGRVHVKKKIKPSNHNYAL